MIRILAKGEERPLVGDIFGYWEVLKQTHPPKKRKPHYLCRCRCGKERTYSGHDLLRGRATKCRSCTMRDRVYTLVKISIGDMFGYWKVFEETSPDKRGVARFHCRCKCGKEQVIGRHRLVYGATKKCRNCKAKDSHAKRRVIPLPHSHFGDWVVIKQTTPNSQGATRVLCRCKCGTERVVTAIELRRQRSKNCGCSTESQEEKSLFDFIESITNTQIIRNDRKALEGKEIDIFLPELKTGIEYNGNYWHSEAVQQNPKKHFEKRILAEKHGIRLIQIRSDEWLNKPEIIKSILRNVLGATENRLFARKLIIKKVKPEEAQLFLMNNHLMGTYKAAQHLGLYTTEDQLVQLFSYQIQREGLLLDCSRICALRNHVIVGGVSRLLKAVLKQHPALTKVVSFVDLRYADGHSLAKMGFVLENTTLGWGWVDGNSWFNRRRCKADKARNLTEKQHAALLGWSRLYDAGQAKLMWKI